MCVSASRHFGVMTHMLDVLSRQTWWSVFVLMSRIPDFMLLNGKSTTRGKLPGYCWTRGQPTVTVVCLMIPACRLRRPLSRAKHVQDASADVHGHGSGVQGDLLRHDGAGAADWSWWRRGLRHWRYQHSECLRVVAFSCSVCTIVAVRWMFCRFILMASFSFFFQLFEPRWFTAKLTRRKEKLLWGKRPDQSAFYC